MTESWHDSFVERLDDTYAGNNTNPDAVLRARLEDWAENALDPQAAADAAAEELGAWLAGRTVDDRLGRDLRAVLNGYARMAAELEQMEDQRDEARQRLTGAQARLDYFDSRAGAVHTMAFLESELARTKAELEQAKRTLTMPILRQAWRNGWSDRARAVRDAVRVSDNERDAYERAFARYMSEDPAEADKDPYRPLDGPGDPAAVPPRPADEGVTA